MTRDIRTTHGEHLCNPQIATEYLNLALQEDGPGTDQYLNDELVPAQTLHDEIRERYGDAYRTPGYYLRLYRLRVDLTQVQLASQAGIRQRHLSEMENNKRSIDKTLARKLAQILNFDYCKLIQDQSCSRLPA